MHNTHERNALITAVEFDHKSEQSHICWKCTTVQQRTTTWTNRNSIKTIYNKKTKI